MGVLEKIRPDLSVICVSDIDIASLRSDGFDTLLLDLDNTLLPWKNSDVPDFSRHWIESARQAGMKLCIVSNTHNPRRLAKIAADLDVLSVYKALKPRRSGFDRAVKMLETEAGRCVVVGDQLFTDILGGNLAGMYTILVKPMHPREFFGTKISRLLEKFVFVLLRMRSESGTNQGHGQSEERDSK